MAETPLETMVAGIETLLAGTDDMSAIVAGVVRLARPLAEDTSWIGRDLYATDDDQGFGVTALYVAADDGLLVETVCWAPGRGVAPHDHKTWGVVVGLDGEEINVDWRRLDDGTRDGHAELETARELAIRRGVAATFLPDDIHSVRNDGAEPSLSLHIYGRNLANINRSEFDPVNNIQRPCPKRSRR